jgi:inorganic pyrophosphatase
LDHDEADDKIIAILSKDNIYGKYRDIEDLPPAIIERLTHYFHTYKMLPGQEQLIKILNVDGREKAKKIVEAAMLDYQENFGS